MGREKAGLVEDGPALLNRQTYLTHENDENGRERMDYSHGGRGLLWSGVTLVKWGLWLLGGFGSSLPSR